MTPVNKRAGIRPEWLKIRVPGDLDRLPLTRLINDFALNTVCQEARCPNIFECWGAGTATFMVLGEICTRRCTFCAVGRGAPLLADADEPRRVAEAVHAVRERSGAAVEVLISDLEGNRDALRAVIASQPEVLAHNVETVPRLYSAVRPVAKYDRSIELLRWAHEERNNGMLTKSSIMLGLGESENEVLDVARDLREAG